MPLRALPHVGARQYYISLISSGTMAPNVRASAPCFCDERVTHVHFMATSDVETEEEPANRDHENPSEHLLGGKLGQLEPDPQGSMVLHSAIGRYAQGGISVAYVLGFPSLSVPPIPIIDSQDFLFLLLLRWSAFGTFGFDVFAAAFPLAYFGPSRGSPMPWP